MSRYALGVDQLIAHRRGHRGLSRAHQHKSLLRFITCGSVDDGKSPLIGRLLYESKMIFEDQLAAAGGRLAKKSAPRGEQIDFALLVDGLAAEREQGITIDVAYRFFSTDRRKFIVADTPGHEQYTRNMVTGASTADLAVILIDARKGVLTQTRRHSLPGGAARHPPRRAGRQQDGPGRLLGAGVRRHRDGLSRLRRADRPSRHHLRSRLRPSRATTSSSPATNTPWYHGPDADAHLETVPLADAPATSGRSACRCSGSTAPTWTFAALPGIDRRGHGHAGGSRSASCPRDGRARVARIVTGDGDLTPGRGGQSVTLTLADEIDVQPRRRPRGRRAPPEVANQFEATLVWMDDEPLLPGRPYC